MKYNRYTRPKLSRNKYGTVNNYNSSSVTYSSSSSPWNSSDGFNFSEEDYNILLDGMSPFIGATENEDGRKGLVPAPLAGMQDYYFLKADGSWAYDSAYAWLHEWPVGSEVPRGLEIDGDFNVTGTLNTMDLNVSGRAHFWELVIDKVKANGGQVIVSPSLFEVDWVGGTEIYEMTWDSERGIYYWYWDDNSDVVPNSENYYDWTFQAKEKKARYEDPFGNAQNDFEYYSSKYSGLHFYNTTETAFTKEQFTEYAIRHKLFFGENVYWYTTPPGFPSERIGWGSKWTGFFDRDMKDENGEYLSPKLGLPYDWDSHWMDYYNWSRDFGYIDNETTSLCTELPITTDSHEVVDYGPVDDAQASFEGKVMTRFGRADFLNNLYHTTDDWYDVVVNRPDIWYRFWGTELKPREVDVREIEGSTGIKDKEWADVIDKANDSSYYIEAPDYIGPVIHEWTDGAAGPYRGKTITPLRKIQYFAKRLYMRNDDGTRRIVNECVVGDMMRCKSFNIKEGVYKNVSNKDFWSFIVGTGEGSYIDDDGIEHSAFWIDLVYGVKVFGHEPIAPGNNNTRPSTRYYPLGTYFDYLQTDSEDWGSIEGGYGEAGTYNINVFDSDIEEIIEVPSYFTSDLSRILNLAKVSKKTLTGLENVIEQYPSESEFDTIAELVYSIRGSEMLVNYINDSSTSSTSSTLSSYTRMQKEEDMLNYINNGTLPSNLTDATNIILYGLDYTDSDTPFTDLDSKENPTDLDTALLLSYGITKGGADGSDLENVSSEYRANSKNWKKKIEMQKHNYCSRDYTLGYKFGYGQMDVSVGDSLACLGHLSNTDRMNAIVISASQPIDPELLPPSIAQYHLIDVFGESISKFRWTTIARSGNSFYGNFNIETEDGAFMDMDSDINLYINDIYNNLELVGIHLDGPSSTIKMIGNIELHQHDDGNDDTFSVWDSTERKRVEILPREIPDRESEESLLSASNKIYIDRKSTSFIASSDYIYYETTGSIVGSIFGNPRRANYTLNMPAPWNGSETPRFWFSVSGSSNVGTFTRTQISNSDPSNQRFYDFYIDIGNINFRVDTSDMYLLYGGGTERNLARDANFGLGTATSVRNLVLTLRGYNLNQSITIQNPSFSVSSDGKIFTITNPSTVFNDVLINFYSQSTNTSTVSIDYSFELLVFAQASDLSRSDTRSFRGNAITTGDFVLTTSERDPGSGESVNSLSHFVIGTNGQFFNTSNSRYFYASDDGIEMKWDDVSVGVDTKDGLKLVHQVGTNIFKPSAGMNWVSLPSATEYGNGRIIYVVGLWNRINTAGGGFRVAVPPVPPLFPSGGIVDGSYIESSTSFGIDTNDGGYTYIKLPTFGALSLISLDGFWWVFGGAAYSTN